MNPALLAAARAASRSSGISKPMVGGTSNLAINVMSRKAMREYMGFRKDSYNYGAGYGTEVAEGKETREFDGKMHVLEKAFEPDFAIVKAWKGDTEGNLIFKGTARNFNPMMAMAGKVTIAEVEELVEPGTLDPNFIHTPGIFVQRIFQGEKFEKRIEQRTVRQRN